VLFPNQSGFRYIMLPVGVLTLTLLQRGSLVPATGLAGVVAMLALLHNLETGIAVVAGLGLVWLLRASAECTSSLVLGLLTGVFSAVAVAVVASRGSRCLAGHCIWAWFVPLSKLRNGIWRVEAATTDRRFSDFQPRRLRICSRPVEFSQTTRRFVDYRQ